MIRMKLGLATGVTALAAVGIAIAHPGHGSLPPPSVSFPAHAQSVPFKLFRGNRIVVPAMINGHATQAMLDTGASLTTFDRAYARSIGLPQGMKIQGKGTGGMVEAELVTDVTLELGATRLDKMSVGVMDLTAVSRSLGRPVTVILGRDFFNSAVLSIDWSAGALQIHSPANFSAARDAVALNLTRRGPFNTIPVSIAGGQPIEALFDVGNGGALALPRTYWGTRPELATLRSAEMRTGGVGGLTATRAVTVPELTLAGRTFKGVPAMLSEAGNDEDPTQMANVGIGLLKQFKVDLDLGHDRVYLTPRADAPGFERDRSGARFDLVGDRLKATFVSPQGPAARAGLKAGDEITAVDGATIDGNFYDRSDWTRGPAGQTAVLTRADGTTVRIRLADYY
jgi:hypothetical protein